MCVELKYLQTCCQLQQAGPREREGQATAPMTSADWPDAWGDPDSD